MWFHVTCSSSQLPLDRIIKNCLVDIKLNDIFCLCFWSSKYSMMGFSVTYREVDRYKLRQCLICQVRALISICFINNYSVDVWLGLSWCRRVSCTFSLIKKRIPLLIWYKEFRFFILIICHFHCGFDFRPSWRCIWWNFFTIIHQNQLFERDSAKKSLMNMNNTYLL